MGLYDANCETFKKRILEAMKSHPNLRETSDVYDLHDCGIQMDDIRPSLMQATLALSAAQAEWRAAGLSSQEPQGDGDAE